MAQPSCILTHIDTWCVINQGHMTEDIGIDDSTQISSIPTMLAFSRQEAQLETRLTSVEEMKDKDFLRLWIEDEAMRGASGGKGGGLFGGLFGLKHEEK